MLNSISGMRVIHLVLLLVTNQLSASEATSLTAVVKFEQCQTDNLGHVFLQGNDVSLRKCAAHCSKKEWCKGLAFGKNLMLCSLYNSMISWEKRQSCRGDCAVIYKENLTGMNFADVDLEELKECDEFVTVANGIVLGNMNREGNRKQVVCNTGFKIQNGSDISQCRNGIWAPKPACVPGLFSVDSSLTVRTIVSECAAGWRKHGNACYLLLGNFSTADEANNTCTSAGAKLLTMTTDDDRSYISFSEGITGTSIWSGLRMKGDVLQNMYTNETVSMTIKCYLEQLVPSGVDRTCVVINWSFAPYDVCNYPCIWGFNSVFKKAFGI